MKHRDLAEMPPSPEVPSRRMAPFAIAGTALIVTAWIMLLVARQIGGGLSQVGSRNGTAAAQLFGTIPLGLAGLVTLHVAWRRIDRSYGRQREGMLVAESVFVVLGLVAGYLGALIVSLISLAAAVSGSSL